MQRADAVAVQPEVLGEEAGDEHLHARGHEQPHRPGVFVGVPRHEALVGGVEQRQHTARLHHGQVGPPLVGGRVHAGGVVCAHVQQHDGAQRQGGQVGQQSIIYIHSKDYLVRLLILLVVR